MKRESNEIKKENDRAASFMRFCEVVRHLRAEDGCPWDRAQTHTSLKPYCIEEAAEVIGGINIWEATGDAENLKEELGGFNATDSSSRADRGGRRTIYDTGGHGWRQRKNDPPPSARVW